MDSNEDLMICEECDIFEVEPGNEYIGLCPDCQYENDFNMKFGGM